MNGKVWYNASIRHFSITGPPVCPGAETRGHPVGAAQKEKRMKHSRSHSPAARAAAVLLTLALVFGLCSCHRIPAIQLPGSLQPSASPAGSASPAETGGDAQEPQSAGIPRVSYTPGEYELVPFAEMEYVRPDMDALEELFTATRDYAATANEDNGRSLGKLLETCWDAYDEFYTMETLAMLRHDIDQSDEYYAEEYSFCWDNDVLIEQWLDMVLTACAASDAPVSSSLLAGYDAPGAAEPYSDRAMELMAQESSLVSRYWDEMDAEEIEIDGRTVNYADYIADPAIDDTAYSAARVAYYRACNEAVAPIYIELVKVRRELASELGYSSYEQYQYDSFSRDYTPAQVREYLAELADTLRDYYRAFTETDPYSQVTYDPLSTGELLDMLQQSIADMGDVAASAFALMRDYDLYDATVSDNKYPGAYTIYIDSYEAPFVFMDAYGDVEDFLDMAHEFGHFTDAYCNYNATGSLDLAETYSQAMANLALYKSREFLDTEEFENLKLIHLLSTLSTFTEQSSYAEFESRVYQLSDEELTVDRLNELALECDRMFGVDADEDVSRYYWTQVTHLVESPFYVISYVISADAAVQILERELREPGAGVAVYEDILDWEEDAFLHEVGRVGLESPFSPDRWEHNLQLCEDILSGAFETVAAKHTMAA